MKKLLLFLILLIPIIPHTQRTNVGQIPTEKNKVSQITPKQKTKTTIQYNGYGSKLAKKLAKKGLKPYQIVIAMVETGGVIPPSNNIAGLRKASGDYYEYESFDEGFSHFQRVMEKKYKKHEKGHDIMATLFAVQPTYNPHNGKVWLDRCQFWQKKLFKLN